MGVDVNLVTGKRGTPHISGSDLRAFNYGIAGMDGALQTGKMFETTLAAGNTVIIADGDMVMQGVHWRIDEDTTKEITISNGESGMNRVDLIIAHYHRDSGTGVESVQLEVLEGNPTSGTASAKKYTAGDLRAGDSDCRMAMFKVTLNGFNIESVVSMFDLVPTLVDAQNGTRAYMGSKVFETGSERVTVKKILSDTEVKQITGKNLTSKQLQENVFTFFMNGHYEANMSLVCIGSERRVDSKGYYARFQTAVTGNYRINYLVVCSA